MMSLPGEFPFEDAGRWVEYRPLQSDLDSCCSNNYLHASIIVHYKINSEVITGIKSTLTFAMRSLALIILYDCFIEVIFIAATSLIRPNICDR